MASNLYLFVAYAVVWVGLFAYLYYLQRRQATLRDDIAMLSRLVERRRPPIEARDAEPVAPRTQ